jgi:phospholipase/carboxylesterase
VAAFTGGLIGDKIYTENYAGDFGGTPVFIGSSDPDPHLPVQRVHETAGILRAMHASVNEKIYPGMATPYRKMRSDRPTPGFLKVNLLP